MKTTLKVLNKKEVFPLLSIIYPNCFIAIAPFPHPFLMIIFQFNFPVHQ